MCWWEIKRKSEKRIKSKLFFYKSVNRADIVYVIFFLSFGSGLVENKENLHQLALKCILSSYVIRIGRGKVGCSIKVQRKKKGTNIFCIGSILICIGENLKF